MSKGLTEQEAREKWCPFARVLVTDKDGVPKGTGNRISSAQSELYDASNPNDARCIASECMAWRQGPSEFTAQIDGQGPPDGDGWEKTDSSFESRGRTWVKWERHFGYCGLARGGE